MVVKDQLHRELYFPEPPKRIVSLVPSQSELLVDLGLSDQIVGVTKFCVHPENLRKNSTAVGGTKTVHYDKISKLHPDIIICNKEENTSEMVAKLQEIAPVWVSDISNVPDSMDMISKLGDIFSVSEKAQNLISKIEDEVSSFQKEMRRKKIQKVAYLIWKDPYMAAGNGTFIDSLLRLNRFENIIDQARYPEVEMIQLQKADKILLSSEPFPFKKKEIEELQPLVCGEVTIVDGEYFSWYGSRLRDAFRYFRTLH